MTTTHCVFGSDGIELHFPDKEMYDRYKEDCKKLAVKYYRETREKHGVWAGNQGKFVPSASDLRPADNRYMEKLAGFGIKDVKITVDGKLAYTTGAAALPPNIEQLREAVDAINRMPKPITQLKVVKSVLVEQGAPMLMCHPDDFEFLKNAKLS